MSESPDPREDVRFAALQEWFVRQQPHLAACLNTPVLLSGTWQAAGSDASFRRYFRWRAGDVRLVLMDAPPPEDCRPFVRMAHMLAVAGLQVPRILAQDVEQGFLVLTDLGDQTWLQAWQEQGVEPDFDQALELLIRLQQINVAGSSLPDYDVALLRRELDLFPDWYVKHELGMQLTACQLDWWQEACALLIEAAQSQSRVLVHRDYMLRNLMRSGAQPGLLDFQDAVVGPISYDVISLFKDAFVSWPDEQVHAGLQQYWRQAQAVGLPVPASFAEFIRDCDWMGLQRHLKVIGVFARICHRDGKPGYVRDVPRFFAYIRPMLGRYPELRPLRLLLESLPLPENCR